MTHISDALPAVAEGLAKAVEDKRVTARRHNEYPYTIYNYCDTVQYSRSWDEVTLNCRGLILDDDGFIIARPWKKFFNLGETELGFQFTDPVEVMDKADGSLGILYKTPVGEYAIATRGSFHSEQAEHATQLWNTYYDDVAVPEGITFLFEILIPWNRIIVDYKDTDDLMLLGAVDNLRGYYYGPYQAHSMLNYPGPVVEVFDYKDITTALAHTDRPNAEGFVVRHFNKLVKIKQPNYVEMHRLRFDMTPKRIWQNLAAGKSIEEIIAPLPDEFQEDLKQIAKAFISQYADYAVEVSCEWDKVVHLKDDRKTFAQEASKLKHRSALFSLLDGKPIDNYLWKLVGQSLKIKE